MRSLLAALFVAGCVLPACSTGVDSGSTLDDGAEVDDLSSTRLRAATAMEGVVVAGSKVRVTYDAGDPKYPRAVPYLAVEIKGATGPTTASAGVHPLDGPTAGAMQEISVQGTFPGTPHITVVDENFKVLARSTSVAVQSDGSSVATTLAPRSGGTRLVLVRDPLWSKSMNFEVRVGR